MAFLSAASSIAGLFDDLAENPEDHFVIETSKGSIQIRAIVFGGELSLKEMHVPLMVTAEYRRFDSGEMISQIASFAPQSMRGMKFSTELHKMADTGATHVVFRRLDGSA